MRIYLVKKIFHVYVNEYPSTSYRSVANLIINVIIHVLDANKHSKRSTFVTAYYKLTVHNEKPKTGDKTPPITHRS